MNVMKTSKFEAEGDDVSLKEIISLLWAQKLKILLVGCLSGICVYSISLFIPNSYVANTLLAPAEQSGGGLSSMMKQYGGLASIAGVSLPGEEQGTRAQVALALLESRQFLGDFVERRQILVDLIAAKSWNSDSGRLEYDESVYDLETSTWVRDVDLPYHPKPSRQEAHEALLDSIDIFEDQDTGFISLSVRHVSPMVAANWTKWLVEDLNFAVKRQDVQEAQRSIEYLRQQVSSTPVAELQAVFFELIQSQMETVMLAEVRPEYAFKIIDPAVSPLEYSFPNRPILTVLGAFIGCLLVSLFAIVTAHWDRQE